MVGVYSGPSSPAGKLKQRKSNILASSDDCIISSHALKCRLEGRMIQAAMKFGRQWQSLPGKYPTCAFDITGCQLG